MPKIVPAIFFGHGNPMNTVFDNGYTKAWSRIGRTTPKPKAIRLSPPTGLFQKLV
jgi:4,5-DOPA dioxygenase extradiol